MLLDNASLRLKHVSWLMALVKLHESPLDEIGVICIIAGKAFAQHDDGHMLESRVLDKRHLKGCLATLV